MGREKLSKKTFLESRRIFLKFTKKPKNKIGPIIKICVKIKTKPRNRLGLKLVKLILSEVCSKVSQLLLKFQTRFGKITTNTTITKNINLSLFKYKTALKEGLKKAVVAKQIKKYIAAYFAKNAKPSIIPKIR